MTLEVGAPSMAWRAWCVRISSLGEAERVTLEEAEGRWVGDCWKVRGPSVNSRAAEGVRMASRAGIRTSSSKGWSVGGHEKSNRGLSDCEGIVGVIKEPVREKDGAVGVLILEEEEKEGRREVEG